ncbi:zinc-binding dehydrogenase [Shinella sp.]|uniref:zinc-binding dehydrogenase n=1 Tax=Shinella sp. TaxID=1870904 RepID=UPI0039E59BF2
MSDDADIADHPCGERESMKAWQFVGAHQPLSLTEIGEPTPGPGEVAVGVRAAGLCHSDVGLIEGVIPAEVLLGSVPQTLGHEGAGVVSAVGAGVAKAKAGDRVGLFMCEEGPGTGIPGAYAPIVVLSEDLLVPIPDGVSFADAATGADAGVTPYRALTAAGEVGAGTRVGIVGLGGLGLNAVQIALALGAVVYAAEPRVEVHDVATKLGVTEVVSDVLSLAPFHLDVILDFAGFGTTTADAVLAVRAGGRVVLVGVGRSESTVNTLALTGKNVSLIGSHAGTREDQAAYYELVASGQVTPVLSYTTFEGIGEGLDAVTAGAVVGRLVAVFGDDQ